MNLKILSRKEMADFLTTEESKTYAVIVMTGADDDYLIKSIKNNAKDLLIMEFDDVELDSPEVRERYDPPQKSHVEQALAFSKGKGDIAVACRAGVSRSSAIAYTILTTKVGAEKALECLKMGHHRPNRLMVRYAEEILGETEMVKLTEPFREYLNW